MSAAAAAGRHHLSACGACMQNTTMNSMKKFTYFCMMTLRTLNLKWVSEPRYKEDVFAARAKLWKTQMRMRKSLENEFFCSSSLMLIARGRWKWSDQFCNVLHAYAVPSVSQFSSIYARKKRVSSMNRSVHTSPPVTTCAASYRDRNYISSFILYNNVIHSMTGLVWRWSTWSCVTK